MLVRTRPVGLHAAANKIRSGSAWAEATATMKSRGAEEDESGPGT